MSKDYIRPMSKTWYMERSYWRRFMVRELTSAFVAIYCVFLLYAAYQAKSADSFSVFFEYLKKPASLIWHFVVFLMVTWHTITWFAAAPKALRVYKGEDRVPEPIVAGAHFAAWLVVSLVVAWLVMG